MTDTAAEPEAAETAPAAGPSIHVLMAKVLAELPAVGKTSHNDDDGYSFRGIDDALNALNPILAANGVFYLPTVLKRRYEQRGTGRGAVYYVVHLKVRFRFYGPNGDHVDAVVWGEGMDLADKSTSKAHTAAQKVAVVQAFSISTRETAQNDADKTTPEETHGRPQAHVDPPAADPLWKTIGWESREELDEVYQPLLEMCRHLSPEVQADLKAWRTERSITLPPQKASFPQLYAKVLDLTTPAPTADPATPPVAPPPSPTNVAEEKPHAAEAITEPTPAPEAKAEPKPAPAQPPSTAADPPPAVDADPLTKAQKDLAELQERAQAAASGKTPAEPPIDPAPAPAPSVSAPPTPAKAKTAKSAPKATTAAETAPAKPQVGAAATEAKKADDDDGADPMACTARYDGCAGQIESPQQKDMSQFRWQKPMCKSCTKKTAQAAKHSGDPAPPANQDATS